jgi:hypothetical protein
MRPGIHTRKRLVPSVSRHLAQLRRATDIRNGNEKGTLPLEGITIVPPHRQNIEEALFGLM